MRLDKPFYRLPVCFDVQRLRDEVAALPPSAWAKHPNDIPGNEALRLISTGGGENDHVDGVMLPTPHLSQSPYLTQVLASFGVVWGRSRLLKLGPYAGVPRHADINYHWFNRVRLHIPLVTHPTVRFFCGSESVHMAPGEAWIFDNWRLHHVDNPIDAERIHLVADTAGSASFWQFVAQSGSIRPYQHQYDAARPTRLLTEQTVLSPVMHPAEVDLLLQDLTSELTAAAETQSQQGLSEYRGLLESFRRDWRQLYQLFGVTAAGWSEFTKLRDSLRSASRERSGGITMRTNGVAAHSVLEGRVLRVALPHRTTSEARRRASEAHRVIQPRPIFIVAAPRSGSTLLFETLAASDRICTVGGEAHWLVESIPHLRPGAPGVDSNRLDAQHVAEDVSAHIVDQIVSHLKNNRGESMSPGHSLRFLEKTPKNALRIPFFNRIFPDAQFVFLWREPHENLSSIMEAWRSGDWKTYGGLEGFDGPWSMLLPPGWQQLRGRSLAEIARFQWETTNRIVLDDLLSLPANRRIVIKYHDLVGNAPATVSRLCDFIGIDVDGALASRVAGPLPLSRFVQTAPSPDKWRSNEAAIAPLMPGLETTWQRLRNFR